jgi:large subunit ribosomal protein L9
MELILLERIEKLGQMGDVVTVKPGYARNYLLPQKRALRATKKNIEHFQAQRSQLETANIKRRGEAELVAKKLDGQKVVIIRSAGEAGQLYGSVNARNIADAAMASGFSIERSQVTIQRPVKLLGLHPIRIRLHPEVFATITINVARTKDEAERQNVLGRAIIGDEDDAAEEEAANAAELAELFEEGPPALAESEAEQEPGDAEDTSRIEDEPKETAKDA